MDKPNLNIYDIAEKAGVSIATVSRVLSGADNVREGTRQKVLAVVEATGYTPNAFAQGLGLGSMKMVGILCTDATDLYTAKALSCLEHLLRGTGLDTLLYCTGTDAEDKRHFLGHLMKKGVDAVVLVGSAYKENADNSHIERAAAQAPVIAINSLVECPGVYCVLCDEFEAMRRNVVLLHKAGCRDILYLYDVETYSGMQKLAGYKKGLEDCGLPQKPGLARRCEKNLAAAMQAAAEAPAPDAVLAAEDLLAIGAYKALAGQGRRVPVIGFNNSVLAECATPALTSVDNMVETLCRCAVDNLQKLLNGDAGVPSVMTVSHKLVERETFQTGKGV